MLGGKSQCWAGGANAGRKEPMLGGRRMERSLLGFADDGQDVEEDVDDIGVEVEGGEDVFLRAERQLLVTQNHLRVHGQELREREKRPQ